MKHEGKTMEIGRYTVPGNLRKSFLRGHPSRIILTLTILACCVVLSAPTYASCKYAPVPNSPVGQSKPHAFQTQALAQEAVGANENDNASIVGFWQVFFTSGGQPFDEGYDQWHSDGTEILNDTAPPQPANGAGTICLGVYKKTGPRTYKLKHPFWSFDATGALLGTGVILEAVTVDQSGNHYTGSFEFITYDLNGNVTSDTKGDLKAERITVDLGVLPRHIVRFFASHYGRGGFHFNKEKGTNRRDNLGRQSPVSLIETPARTRYRQAYARQVNSGSTRSQHFQARSDSNGLIL